VGARTTLLVLCLLTAGAQGQSARELIAQGNEKYRAKDFDTAADLYHKAQEGKNAPAAALFNEGCALLEQNKLADAAERFRAADTAGDTDLSARARYNLGQSLFKQADALKEKQPDQAMDLLRQSAAAFRSVLDVKPDDSEAARNVEIARRAMKQIEDKKQEQQKQQQRSQGDKQNQDQKNQDKQNQQQQSGGSGSPQSDQSRQDQKQADDLQKLAQQQAQAAKDSQQAQQSGADQKQLDDLKQKQQSLKDQTAKAQQKAQSRPQPSDQTKDESQKLQEAQAEQQRAIDDLQNQNATGAKEHQEKAAQLLDQAAKDAAQQAQQQAQKDQQARDQQAKDQQAKQAQAAQQAKAKESNDEPKHDQTAAALLDREKQQRQQRMPVIRAARGQGPPVDKDW
jgi:Ca-activated chloride channel homolog